MLHLHRIRRAPYAAHFILTVYLLCEALSSPSQVTDSSKSGTALPHSGQVTSADLPYESLSKTFIINGFKDGTNIISQPLRWKKKDWLRFSAVITAVGATMAFDKEIKKVALRNQHRVPGTISHIAEPFGNFYSMGIFPVIYATGAIAKNRHIESIGLRGSKAVAITAAITFMGKNIIRRQRPDATPAPFNYAAPFAKTKYTSTPSAHAAIAFTLAAAVSQEFPDKKWVAPVAYSVASLTAISRIYDNRHWASDVVLGAALGHFATRAVYRLSRQQHRVLPTFQ